MNGWVRIMASAALLAATVAVGPAWAGPCDAVKKEMAFGEAAAEDAKDAAGFKLAADQFFDATQKAPDCAAAFYNLGIVQEKAGALTSAKYAFEKYLKLAPKAVDAAEVEKKIFKLEYRISKGGGAPSAPAGPTPAESARTLTGLWLNRTQHTVMAYQITPDGSDSVLLEFGGCRQGCANFTPFPVNRTRMRVEGPDRFAGEQEIKYPDYGKCRGRLYKAPVTAFLSADGQSLVVKTGPHRPFVVYPCAYMDWPGSTMTLTRR